MVKIYSLMLLKMNKATNKPIVLCNHIDTGSSWSTWMFSNAIADMAKFLSKLLCEKTQPGCRQQVEKDELVAYVHKRDDGLTCVLVTDKDYPYRVAFDIVRKTMTDFGDYTQKEGTYSKANTENFYSAYNNTLKQTVDLYQDPTKGDNILKVKKELDETKEVLHQTLEKLLDRGESLDELVQKSEELESSTIEFYKRTKDTKCCIIL
ncbi:synaptobrevin [Acrasis kona]|uniref:Synaptobrevin n=1 Tax=Acrasis kona TaxID=1008807 RepID=A0AAW2YNW6_9EUKA